MPEVPPDWSLDALLREWQPQPSWRNWFAEAYALVTAGTAEEQLKGWQTAAIIFGDS